MNYQKNKKMIIGVIILAVILLGIWFWYFYQSKDSNLKFEDNNTLNVPVENTVEDNQVATETPANINESVTSLEYKNTEFGFNFILPVSWKGYSIVKDNWEGYPVNGLSDNIIDGSKILIRHPLWTKENPRQDIPVMIFTPSQWDLIQKEKLAVSAAPIGPSELGRNANYIFALPARYNYAFPTGFEEVQTIIDSKPLQGF